MKRWDIINFLQDKNSYRDYLEIGVRVGENMRNVSGFETKVGVDPEKHRRGADVCHVFHQMTSDKFFAINQRVPYDLIFIDGLHHAEQVRRDLKNAANALTPGGTIVVHDCCPWDEKQQIVPRMQRDWTGDVWKAWAHFRWEMREMMECFVIDTDCGVGVARWCSEPWNQIAQVDDAQPPHDMDWSYLEKHRQALLGLVTVEESEGLL